MLFRSLLVVTGSDQGDGHALDDGPGVRPHATPPQEGLRRLLDQHAHAIGELRHARVLCQAKEGGQALAVRQFVGQLRVNSWYRSRQVNNAVGGEQTSYHLDALATDVVPKGDVLNAFKMLVASDLDYDKIIYEKRRSEWIHIQSPQPGRSPRKLAYIAHPNGNKMEYEQYVP